MKKNFSLYPVYFIAKNNLKKQKGDMFILFLLTLVSGFLMFSSLSILFGADKVQLTAKEAMNGADVQIFTSAELKEIIGEAAAEDERIVAYETAKAYVVSADFRKDGEEEWTNYGLYIGSFEEQGMIGKVSDDADLLGEKDIVLPYYLHDQFPEGDCLELKIGAHVYEFRVAGYVQDPVFNTPLNITVYRFYLSDAACERLLVENEDVVDRWLEYKVQVAAGTGSQDVEIDLYREIVGQTAGTPLAGQSITSVNWDMMKPAGMIMTNLSLSAILIFAVMIILVAAIIVSFSIRNFMERNMKNTGILEAVGYTTGQLRSAVFWQVESVALSGALVGIGLGILGSNAIGNMESRLLGLAWNQPLNVYAMLVTLLAVFGMVGLVVLRTARTYKQISVLDALRGGIHAHNFRKNYFPVEKTKLPLPILMSFKELLGAKGKNILLSGIVAVLAITTCVGFGMYESFGKNGDILLDLAGIDVGTAGFSLDASDVEAIRKLDEVETLIARRGYGVDLRSGERTVSISCDAYDQPRLLRHDVLLEGRFPKYDNEIVLTTTIAKELNVAVGDVIYAEIAGEQYDFIVCGIDQKINNGGRKCMLTLEGAERMYGKSQWMYCYVYAKEGVTFEELERKIMELAPDSTVENGQQQIEQTIGSVSLAMKMICIVLVAVTTAVVVLVETLLIRSKIIRQWHNLGISKALGFTTGQLMWQTALSNLPAVILGALIGTLFGNWVSKRAMVLALSSFGIKKVEVVGNVGWLVVTFAGIVLVALVTALLFSGSIRKAEPVKMLAGSEE